MWQCLRQRLPTPTHACRSHAPQHCSYRYLLHLDGVTNSDRLKYLLACGSAVIWLREAPAAASAAAAPGRANSTEPAGGAGRKPAQLGAAGGGVLAQPQDAAAGGAGREAAQPDGEADVAPAMRAGVYEEFWYHVLKVSKESHG